ncbi:MAG: hypothetical protein HKN73_17605 [Gemmatimonadetes bacterium]|nr:hypothetical protein [Gemmatimonadota bacterium]
MIRKRNQFRERLGAETLELFSYLDGELAGEALASLEARLEADPRLGAALGEWSGLFEALRTLEAHSPSPDFKVRVMAVLSARPSFLERSLGWLWGRGPRRQWEANPFVAAHEGRLARSHARALAAYMAKHPEAQAAAGAWRALQERLDGLPRLAPSDGFAERVMARLEATGVEMRKPSLAARVATRLWPGRKERLAALGGMAVGPTAVVGATAYMVLSNPLATPTNLLSFVWAKAVAMVSALGDAAVGSAFETGAVTTAWSLLEGMALSGPVLAAAALSFGVLTVLSSWILYRNVIKVTPMEAPYVTA